MDLAKLNSNLIAIECEMTFIYVFLDFMIYTLVYFFCMSSALHLILYKNNLYV